MLRRLLNPLTAVSLLLCGAVCVMWPLSYRAAAEAWWTSDAGQLCVLASRGEVALIVATFPAEAISVEGRVSFKQRSLLDLRTDLRSLGDASDWFPMTYVVSRAFGKGDAVTARIIIAPIWLLLASAVMPAAFLIAHHVRGRGRQRSSHCPRCGYDLTANVSGVCPECGRGR